MHGLMSYRRFGRAWSLRSDRAWLELGRYVAAERDRCSVAMQRPSLTRARLLHSDRASLARARSLRSDRAWLELGRYVATERQTLGRASLARARSLRSDRAERTLARSLRSDRTACMCGSCVMTELGSSVF
ncbi:hypothetical protein F2Q69_00023965 [Brassica cretica]|uniref:Uncharacterized protein n=1 Tax=Brassica cretica TaxID=69181 RepID=A0A8S9QA53_BRACR|nr:hypothetical protein F2Q69_00023965 [Brassica cretica]